jgi:hypothetical protein
MLDIVFRSRPVRHAITARIPEVRPVVVGRFELEEPKGRAIRSEVAVEISSAV